MDEPFFYLPSRVLFGMGVFARAGQTAAALGSRALLVTDAILREERVTSGVEECLERAGVSTIVFDELGPESTSSALERAIELGRASRAQMVVGLGGIRSLSAAKCVARMVPAAEPLDDYLSGGGDSGASLPYLEIPTTCRNPLMFTDRSLIVDARNRRTHVLRTGKRADWVIVDPELTLSLSARYTVTTLMDTLLTAIEAYFSPRSTFFSETLCLRAIGIITSIIDELSDEPQNRELRIRAAEAGFLTGVSLTMSAQGLGSAVAYALNGWRMVPKSMVAGVMLPHVLDLAVQSQPKKIERIGNVLGEEIYGKPLKEFSVRVADAVRQRMSLLRLPMRLKDFDLGLEDVAEVASIAFSLLADGLASEPTSVEQIADLVKEAL